MIDNMYTLGRSVYRSLNRYRKLGIKGLDKDTRNPEFARELMERLGVDEEGMEVVIVSGSKGKGSTARMISSILSRSGKRVGLFTSPHLVHFNERIRVDGKYISDEDFIRLGKVVDEKVREMEEEIPEDTYIGPVGILLVTALLYFKEKGVEYGVFEVGLGGEYDEVNVLHNKWAVLTPMFREHLNRIGPGLKDVVRNKLGIIKVDTEKTFVGKQTLESSALIKRQGKNAYGELIKYGKDFKAEKVRVFEDKTKCQVVTPKSMYNIQLPLVGNFQAENTSLALSVAEDILGDAVDGGVLKETIEDVNWPGRCEVLDYGPLIVADGTVHRASAIHVRSWIYHLGDFDRVSVIVSLTKDKDYQGVVEELEGLADRFILVEAEYNVRDYPDEEEVSKFTGVDVYEGEDLEEAFQKANEIKPELILIVGTQHIVGDAKRFWGHDLEDIGK